MLLTRPPLDSPPKRTTSSDLHVLRTPPAFVLSQDQTRHPMTFVCLEERDHQPALANHHSSSGTSVKADRVSYAGSSPARLKVLCSGIQASCHEPPATAMPPLAAHAPYPLPLLALCCFSLFSCSGSSRRFARLRQCPRTRCKEDNITPQRLSQAFPPGLLPNSRRSTQISCPTPPKTGTNGA